MYDKANPETWEQWIEQRSQFLTELDRGAKLSVIKESHEEFDGEGSSPMDVSDSLTVGIEKVVLSDCAPAGADFSAFFFDADNQVIAPFSTVFSHIVPYLSTPEVRNVAIASKGMHQHCQRVEVFKLRRREALTQIAANQSRVKKTEKKKKAKQANVKKESKKDGFARGGNS